MRQRSKRPGTVRRVLVIGLLLPACGCGLARWAENGFKLGPNYSRPEAAVADQWIEDDDERVTSRPPDHSDWWSALNDPVLNDLIETAYNQNLTLREAGFRVLQSRADRDIAIGNLFPQQQIGTGSFSWNQASEVGGAPSSQTSLRRTIVNDLNALQNTRSALVNAWAGPPTVDSTFNNWSFGASVSWELDIWGRFRRAVESADAALKASVNNYQAVLVSLTAEVATAYVEVRTAQLQLDYARRNVEIQKGSLELSTIQAREGKTSDLGVYLAQSSVKATEATIPGLDISLRQANNRLCTLLGIPTTELLEEIGTNGIPTAPPELALGIPADLLRRRPDVREAERNLAAQSEQIGIAEAELYPQFVLNGDISIQAERFKKLWRGNSFGYSAGPSFTWNILNYGRLINNVRFQEAAFQELVATYQNTVLEANQEVEDALVSFLQTQEQVQFLADNVEALQQALNLAIIQFEEGAIDFTAVFVLQGALTQAQDQLGAAQGNVILSLINVYKALGGGWEVFPSPEEIPTPAIWEDESTAVAEEDELPGRSELAGSDEK